MLSSRDLIQIKKKKNNENLMISKNDLHIIIYLKNLITLISVVNFNTKSRIGSIIFHAQYNLTFDFHNGFIYLRNLILIIDFCLK